MIPYKYYDLNKWISKPNQMVLVSIILEKSRSLSKRTILLNQYEQYNKYFNYLGTSDWSSLAFKTHQGFLDKPRIVMSLKQHWDPSSGSPTELKMLLGVCFKFPFHLVGQTNIFFFQANHGAYSNHGTQVRNQNKDFQIG